MQREPQPPTFGQHSLEVDGAAAALVPRLGSVFGGGALASAVSSLPGALRSGDGSSVLRTLEQWVALTAILMPLAVLVVMVFRRGRIGLQVLAGDRSLLIVAAALWCAVVDLGALSVFGAILRAKTHHRGLAGVTFAVLALFTCGVVALVAVRGVRMLLKMPASAHRVALAVVAATSFLVVALIGVRISRADRLPTVGALVDGLALLISSAIGSSRFMTRWRPFVVAGPPLALTSLVLGFVCLRVEPDLSGHFSRGAPVQAWLLSFF